MEHPYQTTLVVSPESVRFGYSPRLTLIEFYAMISEGSHKLKEGDGRWNLTADECGWVGMGLNDGPI